MSYDNQYQPSPQQPTPPSYQQPVQQTQQTQQTQPTQPAQPINLYDSQEIPTVQFVADKESLEIIKNSYPELNNALLNLAVKRFAESSEYYKYFLKKEIRVTQEPVQEEEQKAEGSTASTTPTTVSTAGSEFQAW